MFNKGKKHIFDFKEVKTSETDEIKHEDIELDDLSVTEIKDDFKEEEQKDSSEDKVLNKEVIIEEVTKEEPNSLDNDFQETDSVNKEESRKDFQEIETVSSDNLEVSKENKFKEALVSLASRFKGLSSKVSSELNKRGYRIDKKLISFHINESLATIVLLIIAIVGLFQAIDTYQAIGKLPLIKKHYQLKKDIKIEDEKIKENIKAEYLADILRFGVKTENGRYPENGYLEAFNQVFPENIGDLQLLTFLEGWGSEFKDYEGRKIRVDHGLIKTFKQDNSVIDNGMLKGYKYKLVLEGDPKQVDNFLYNIRYSNKIPKYFTKINKKYNSAKGLLTVDMDVLFYLSK